MYICIHTSTYARMIAFKSTQPMCTVDFLLISPRDPPAGTTPEAQHPGAPEHHTLEEIASVLGLSPKPANMGLLMILLKSW